MPSISIIVNTLNEEANLADCLASVKDLADEIVVVDMHSDDRTVEIAKEFGAKVYQHDRVGYVEPARNFAFAKATGDWLLVLDADERATPGLCKEVRRIVEAPEAEVYYLPRKNLFLGQWVEHGLWWPDYQLRLWKRGKITWPNEIHGIPKAEGSTAQLEAKPTQAIVHHAYETVSEFMDMVNGYTKYEVETLRKEGYRFRRRHLLVATSREFWRRYVTARGYKDGWIGLVLAFLHTSYRGVAIIKYWEKYGKTDFHDKGQSLPRAVGRVMLDK